MGPRMYPDNRNNRRVPCQARFLGASTTAVRGDLVDLSATGVCLALEAELERGRELHLEFDLPTGRVEAVAEVRWCVRKEGAYEVGLRWVRISSESMNVITTATAPRPPLGGGFWFSQTALRR